MIILWKKYIEYIIKFISILNTKIFLFKLSFIFLIGIFFLHTKKFISLKVNKLFINNYSTKKDEYSNLLGPYLAGLIEGDGSILVPGINVSWAPYIEITFDIKDLKLIEKIKSTLGGGYITIRPNGNSGRLHIKKLEILLKVILLINGHMRTPKREALHRLIVWYNNKKNVNIPLLGVDTEPLSDSSWLSGFLEADGNFYFNFKLNNKNIPIGVVYYGRISQKQNYTRKVDSSVNISNLPHMEQIAELLEVKVVHIERNRDNFIEKAYEVRSDTIRSKNLLFEYLNKFPLFGYKYYSSFNLEKIHELVLSKEHKTLEGSINCQIIKV